MHLPIIKWFLAGLFVPSVKLSEFYPPVSQPDLTTRQLCVFMMIYDTKKVYTIKMLGDDLNISKSAVTRAIAKLVDLGYVVKNKRTIQKTFKGLCYTDVLIHHFEKASETYYAMFRSSSERSLLSTKQDANTLIGN